MVVVAAGGGGGGSIWQLWEVSAFVAVPVSVWACLFYSLPFREPRNPWESHGIPWNPYVWLDSVDSICTRPFWMFSPRKMPTASGHLPVANVVNGCEWCEHLQLWKIVRVWLAEKARQPWQLPVGICLPSFVRSFCLTETLMAMYRLGRNDILDASKPADLCTLL